MRSPSLNSDFLEIAGDPRFHLNALNRFDAPDKILGLGHGLAFGCDHPDGNGSRLLGCLGVGGR